MLALFMLFFSYVYRTLSCHSLTFHHLLKTKKWKKAFFHQNPRRTNIKPSEDPAKENIGTKLSVKANYDCRIISSTCKQSKSMCVAI